MKITFFVLFAFTTVLKLVDLRSSEDYDWRNGRGENYGGSESYGRREDYDRGIGYTEGSGRYDEFGNSRNTEYGNPAYSEVRHHEGRGGLNGMNVRERALEGGERKIHSMVEEGVEKVLSKTGLDERKTERFAEMAADEAVKISEREFRKKSREGLSNFNQMEGYERGITSRGSGTPTDDYYTRGSRASSSDDFGTNNGGYQSSGLSGTGNYGGQNEEYRYGGSRRDAGFVGGVNENRFRGYENEGRRDDYGDRRDQYGYEGSGYGGEYSGYPRNEGQQEFFTTGERYRR